MLEVFHSTLIYSTLCSWLYHVCCGYGVVVMLCSVRAEGSWLGWLAVLPFQLALLLLNQSDSDLRWSLAGLYCRELLHPMLLQTPYQSYYVYVCVWADAYWDWKPLRSETEIRRLCCLPPNMLHRCMWLLPLLWALLDFYWPCVWSSWPLTPVL
jgi:hypothetical protein